VLHLKKNTQKKTYGLNCTVNKLSSYENT